MVQDRTISDTISCIELQRPRIKLILPQWDLGIVLEVLSKPLYEPLREASLNHLTLKTVFILHTISSAWTPSISVWSEIYSWNPRGPHVHVINQKPNQVNDPRYIPAVPTGKSDYGAPNCPVRAFRYYHRYIIEHPELRNCCTDQGQ